MPIIEPGNPELKTLEGIHLWHGGLSSCSQRVRVVLEEKGLDWESHVVNMAAREHATPAYQAIHPKGVVPAFVDDGTLLIESIDIIDYLDERHSDHKLRPSDPAEEAQMKKRMKDADDSQKDLKLISHEFLFQPTNKRSPEDFKKFAATHSDPDLIEFHRVFHSEEGFPREDVAAAVKRTDEGFKKLDAALENREWLAGENITLADVAWMPNLHRVDLMNWPLDRYSNLMKWFKRVEARSSYQKGLVGWEPEKLHRIFKDYVAQRAEEGTDVRSFL